MVLLFRSFGQNKTTTLSALGGAWRQEKGWGILFGAQ